MHKMRNTSTVSFSFPRAPLLTETYYLLGKNRPGSGILLRYSSSPSIFHTIAVMPITARPAMAVLRFQLAGCAYQPPEGDQTCFGYLFRG